MTSSRHGGNWREMTELAGCDPSELIDFSANMNPCGFPDWVRPRLSSQVSHLIHYPDPAYVSLKRALQERYHIPPEQVVFGNGSSELLYALPRALKIQQAVIPIPSFYDYERALIANDIPCDFVNLREEENFCLNVNTLEQVLRRHSAKRTLVVLGQPNNPTGTLIPVPDLRQLTTNFPGVTFLLDEAFIELSDPEGSFRSVRPKNMIILWSLTKSLAIPGLRAGLVLAEPEICHRLNAQLPPWSLNSMAASIVEASLRDLEFVKESCRKVHLWRVQLLAALSELSEIKTFASSSNFILLKLIANHLDAPSLRRQLLKEWRIGIRSCENFRGLNAEYFRVAVRIPSDNAALAQALTSVFRPTQKFVRPSKKNPALMFQGTASNVGKSILTAAMARIFYQDGISVAPFKSQNMALNSFVTVDGAEIGRAQALQAQAAKVIPDYRMNPILLKPSNDHGSQVILNGVPVANMDFREYTRFKPEAFIEAKKSYDSLANQYQAVIIEGAGSASEVNLKSNDLVNMRMAEYAQAKVLLVGNIDHGGIFGAFIGTLETMAEWERRLVAGFVINRFRGIKELLKPGEDYLLEHTGKPVLGIVPYLKNLALPEEDSLEFKSGRLSDPSPLGDRIDIVLIDTPRISNHTDIDALRLEPDVRLRIVDRVQDLGNPHVIVLGGSKNVVSDLQHLNSNGISGAILNLASLGRTEIVGICGGYQMLGQELLDPGQIESTTPISLGLGLLPLSTTLYPNKTLKQVEGLHLRSKHKIMGYEIHHGKTVADDNLEVSMTSAGSQSLGHTRSDGLIWGTYVHGVFDQDPFRRWFIDRVRLRTGKVPLEKVQVTYDLENSLDRLAEQVRAAIDIPRIYKMLDIR